jgi:hypothetical protein
MPLRKTTRAQNRAHYVASERHHHKRIRKVLIAEQLRRDEAIRIIANDEPPPF